MTQQDARISRRTILRGLGTAMAVPLLDAFSPSMTLAASVGATKAAAPPLRMAFLFTPNGVNVREWFPTTAGRRYVMPWSLEALEPHRDHFSILTGLTHDKGRGNSDGPGDHARSAGAFLTGMQPVKTDGADIRLGISVDQVAARAIGGATRFPSLELSCDAGRNSGNCDSGYSCAYSNNISWASPTTPMAKEVDPRRVFDRLFAADNVSEAAEARARRLRQRKSVLDFVLDDARRLENRLGARDQRKLDEYFASVREIEKRTAKADKDNELARVAAPENLPSEAGVGLSFEEHIRLLSDMIVLAFQGDVTRISTLMYAREGSNRSYRFVDVPDGHHDLSHHQGRPEKLDKIRRIDRFHATQFAYILERLRSIQEGDGTLLDNCMIVFGAGINDGNRHNNENLPIILAGGGGGTLDTGRHVRYTYETPMCNLFLSMLDRAGVHVDAFGDSTGRLADL